MLIRTLAFVLAALAAIVAATALAPSPAAAQSGGDSTAAATPTPAPAPMATSTVDSFALAPHTRGLKPRGLARLGNKWHVSGHRQDYVYIFSDAGAYERRIWTGGGSMPGYSIRGLTGIGADLVGVSGRHATSTGSSSLFRWTPQSAATAGQRPNYTWVHTLPTSPGGDKYNGHGVAYDGTHIWVAADVGSGDSAKYFLLKYNPAVSSSSALVGTFPTNLSVSSLTHENGYLYGVTYDQNRHLVRISPTNSSFSTTATNNWEIVRRNVEIQHGLVFHNGAEYGFNLDNNEARKARRPSPERIFALTPSIGDLNPRGLARLGNKWHVGGWSEPYIYIFSDSGAYERRIKAQGHTAVGGVYIPGVVRGLTANGAKLLVAMNQPPRVYEWTPQANDTAVPAPSSILSLGAPPGGGEYHIEGIAHDGTNAWVAASWPRSGDNSRSKHGLLKLNATGIETTYAANLHVSSLAYENGYLYALSGDVRDPDPDLLRIKIGADSTLQSYTAAALRGSASPPMNNWETVRRSVGIRAGLAFRNGTAYGFNLAYDEVRKARQPSPERLIALTPTIGDLNPRGLTRLGNKWFVGGWRHPYVYVFSNTGAYERRIRAEGDLWWGNMNGVVRGLTANGGKLVAVTNQPPRVYEWTPQANDAALPVPSVIGLTTPPGGGTYHAEGIAHDGTNAWVAASWPFTGANKRTKHGLLKLNDTGIATIYATNGHVSSLAYENGYLYALSGDVRDPDPDLLRIKVGAGSTLQGYTAAALLGLADPPVNNWETVRRSVEIRGGLAFRNGMAYGFNFAWDEVREERRTTATTPTAPASP